MSTPSAPAVPVGSREALARLADALIPSADGMPAASEVSVHGKWLDRVLAARPDIAEDLLRVLSESNTLDPNAEIERIRTQDPAGYAALLLTVAGAYYMHPKVRKLIGYPGQKANLPFPDEAEWYLRDGLLDPVVARGPIFRQADGPTAP